jgi:hypothetical protein
MAVIRRCTAAPIVVYTVVSCDHPKQAALGPSLPNPVRHRPRGGGATGQEVAVPPRPSTSSQSCKLLRDSIYVNSSYSPQAMLTLKVFSQNMLEPS